ncbi:transcriptional regulator, MerR family [Enterococcus faecalis 13-SD-W-01]|nr:transcriptional regulator, MerR family [Enterococcus faecalis 13-SD-W-01]
MIIDYQSRTFFDKEKKMYLTINDVSKITGLTPYTLRYYAKEGLFDFVERSSNSVGTRLFKKSDLEFIHVIQCLKSAGLSIKDIKTFVDWTMEGDSTIEERLNMFKERQAELEKQIAELQEVLKVVKYKSWYYETAKEAGSCSVHDAINTEKMPEDMLQVKNKLEELHNV